MHQLSGVGSVVIVAVVWAGAEDRGGTITALVEHDLTQPAFVSAEFVAAFTDLQHEFFPTAHIVEIFGGPRRLPCLGFSCTVPMRPCSVRAA